MRIDAVSFVDLPDPRDSSKISEDYMRAKARNLRNLRWKTAGFFVIFGPTKRKTAVLSFAKSTTGW